MGLPGVQEAESDVTIDVYELLLQYPELVFFLTLGLGYLLGHISIFKFRVGPTAGVLVAGLVFGHLGMPPPSPLVQSIGFILFIYCVGVEAGPNFLTVFLSGGLRYFVLGFAAGTWLLRIHPALLMGALTGAMTSTPALNVLTTEARSSVPALGYAGTYTFANVFLARAGALMMILR